MEGLSGRQTTTKVIVRNLPDTWTRDHLLNYLESNSRDLLVEEIQMFPEVSHTALISLKQPVTGERVSEIQQNLYTRPFQGTHSVELEAIGDSTCAVLVRVPDVHVTHDLLFFYFDGLQVLGHEEEGVVKCDMFLEEFGFAVVHFSSAEVAKEVVAQGPHPIQKGNTVTAEPWYDLFHGDLLKLRLSLKDSASSKTLPDPPDQAFPDEHRGSGEDGASQDRGTEQDAMWDMLEAMATRNEQLTNEIRELKNRKEVPLPVPFHQWRLLRNCGAQSVACDVNYVERDEMVVFSGSEEECQEAQLHFLKLIQSLMEEVIHISEPTMKVLKTDKGRRRFEEMVSRHPRCSVKTDRSYVLCAALMEDQQDLELLKRDVEGAFCSKTVKVAPALTSTPQFQALKVKLEEDFLVMVVLPDAGTADVHLHGFADHVNKVVVELGRFVSTNEESRETFEVRGRLEGEACRTWCSQELDQIKGMIYKNGGSLLEESTNNGYTLSYQCRGKVLGEVRSRLEIIRRGIISRTIDLHPEFPDQSEGRLVIQGLREMGTETFCSQLVHTLRQTGVTCLLNITLPPPCPLPPFRRASDTEGKTRTPTRRPAAASAPSNLVRGRGTYHSEPALHTASRLDLPFSVSAGKARITLKMGDITTEQVEAAVCVVGTDLKLNGTAVGSAFGRKCPALNEILRNAAHTQRAAGRDKYGVILTRTPATATLPMSTILHAVLTKLTERDGVKTTVKDLVYRSLWMSEEGRIRSIALPPVGVGKRFGYGGFTTATAMMSAIHDFLVNEKPKHLRTIHVVVYNDTELAGKFVDAMTRAFPEERSGEVRTKVLKAMTLMGRTLSRGVSALSHKIQSRMKVARTGTSGGRERGGQKRTGAEFEARVCVTKAQDVKQVKDILRKELHTTFLWQETLWDQTAEAFHQLPRQVVQDIAEAAAQKNVLLSAPDRALHLRGQKHKAQEVHLLIKDRIQDQGQACGPRGQSKRQKLGLPVDTDHLPSYWRVCQGNPTISYDDAQESWRIRGARLNTVGPQTRAAVTKLVYSTWERSKVGRGTDAVNLRHSDIKVLNVERLENPKLWKAYSQKREELFDSLAHHYSGRYAVACRPLETFSDSNGPVWTTRLLEVSSPLRQDVYPQVNEHYLFHGTKEGALPRIFSLGLDDRLCTSAMLGSGVYTAESSTKADQYADPQDNRSPQGTQLKMMLVRVLLGEPYLYTDANPEPFKRPPCLRCHRRHDQCRCRESRLHHSVVYDCSTKLFREFVVYDHEVCYPEYVITYVRV